MRMYASWCLIGFALVVIAVLFANESLGWNAVGSLGLSMLFAALLVPAYEEEQ